MGGEFGTSCLSCVFAVFDGTDTQTGCRVGRLEQFVELGVRVETAYEAEETPEWEASRDACRAAGEVEPPPPRAAGSKTWMEIRGRLCPSCRGADSPWAAAVPPDRRAEKVLEECRLRLHAVVPVLGDDKLADVVLTAEALKAQTRPPAAAHFVINADGVRGPRLVGRLRDLGLPFPWDVTGVVERAADGTRLKLGPTVDIAADKIDPRTGNYYLVALAGLGLPCNMVEELDRALNERLQTFVVIRPVFVWKDVDGNPEIKNGYDNLMVVQTQFHRLVGGHREVEEAGPHGTSRYFDSVLAKAEYMDDTGRMVRDLEDVCPALS